MSDPYGYEFGGSDFPNEITYENAAPTEAPKAQETTPVHMPPRGATTGSVAAQPPQPPEDFVKVNPSTYGNLVAIWQTALMLFSGPPDELPDVEAMRRRMHEAAQPPKEQGK